MSEVIPKTVVFGASGRIGSHLLPALKAVGPALGSSRNNSDVNYDLAENPLRVVKLLKEEGVQAAIILSGMSQVVHCEYHPKEAWKTNVHDCVRLVKHLHKHKIRVIFASTDYVFDGKGSELDETNRANPIVVYGKTKFEAEKQILDATEQKALILRLSKIFTDDPTEPGIFQEMIQKATKNKKVMAASDQWFNPLWVEDLIRIVISLITQPEISGLLHVCGDLRFSRLELAKRLLTKFGLTQCIQAIHLNQLPGPTRPLDTSMNNKKLKELIDFRLTSLETSFEILHQRCS